MATFDKYTPINLAKAAVVPQVLDNQWVPSRLLREMIKKKKKLDDVSISRKKYVLKEWRRALVYGEQVVVNRAFMFNNSVVVRDYATSANRQYFKQLLNTKIIIPFLLGETGPEEKPHFQVDGRLWGAWQEIVSDTQMACIRLDWGDQKDDFKRLSQIFHNYVQTLNKQERAETIATHLRIPKDQFPAFRQRLKEIASYAFQIADQRDVVRNDIYSEFISEKDTNIALGLYNQTPFSAQIKQIIDLKYNVNLPDALSRYALTPEDSPPRSALGDLDDVVSRDPINPKSIEEILYALRRLAFEKITSGMYLKSLIYLSLGDIIKIRETDEWEEYRKSVIELLDNPLDFNIRCSKLVEKFGLLNKAITHTRLDAAKAKWEPWVKLQISVGTNAAELLMNSADPGQKLMNTFGTGNVTNGVSPFVMRLTVTAPTQTDADLDVSLDFMRGTIDNSRDVWNEMLGQLRSQTGFKELTEVVSKVHDSNQSPPETSELANGLSKGN